MMNVSVRDLVGVGVLGGVIVVITTPEITNTSIITTIVTGGSVGYITGVIGGVLLLTVLIKGVLSGVSIKGRILESDPEIVTGVTTPVAKSGIESDLHELTDWMREDGGSNIPRYVAMYGQKAVINEEVPVEIENVFDELIQTAAVVYAETHGCSIDEGLTVVKNGEWCDDRKTNAFLAEPGEGVPCFTMLERLVGWVSPCNVFIKRVEGVIRELEGVSGERSLAGKGKYNDGGEVKGGE